MIRIAVTEAAYQAIVASGSVPVQEPAQAPKGKVYLWLDPAVADRLKAMRGPGETNSDVILRLARAD